MEQFVIRSIMCEYIASQGIMQEFNILSMIGTTDT